MSMTQIIVKPQTPSFNLITISLKSDFSQPILN